MSDQPQRYGVMRNAMQIVRGAIQRIDIPGCNAFGPAARFFSHDAKLGCQLCERIQNDLLGFLIGDRKSTRLNSSHVKISYAVFCLKKKILYFKLNLKY